MTAVQDGRNMEKCDSYVELQFGMLEFPIFYLKH